MQLQRITSTTLITLLAAATTSFCLNFLAVFPTTLALAQTPTDYIAEEELPLPGETLTEDQIRKIPGLEDTIHKIKDGAREAGDRLREAKDQWQQDILEPTTSLDFSQAPSRISKEERLLQKGNEQFKTSQFQDALQSWEQALTICLQIGDMVKAGTVLNNIGLVHNNLGQYAQALKFHQQALDTHKLVGNKAGERTALNNIGLVYDNLGRYADALKFYQQALGIRKQVGNKAEEGIILNDIGFYYHRLGQYAQALKFYQQALEIRKQVGDKAGEGVTLNNIGLVYDNLGHYPDALKFYQQALEIRKQVGDKAGEGVTLNNIGAVYDNLGRYPDALKFYQQALEIRKQVGDKAGEGVTLNNIGVVFYSLEQYPNAERTLIAAIGVLESLRPGLADANKVSIFETQADTYRLLQQVLIAQNKINNGLEVAERGRARAFVELLATRVSFDRTIQANIAPPTFEQIRQIAKTQRATLIEYSITYNTSKVQGKEKWYPELYIWVVKPTGEVAFRKVDLKLDTNLAFVAEKARIAAATGRNRAAEQQEAILSNLVRGTRDSISQESSNTAANFAAVDEATSTPRSKNQHLQQFHQLLIQPIADLLPTDPEARVIFIPQGPLFLVPFPALQDASGKYLIEKHTILTAPAIKVLELNRQQWLRALGKDMLVVGNPTMPSIPQAIGESPQKLAPLPAAEQEAIEISSLLNTKAITGSQATETAIKQQMPRAGIIHLATHGLLDDFTGGGVPGAIALAPSGKDNGLLTANEILDLKLGAELVVLSACDTGRGRITGDGVIGLSRSLISAGVPSVVVSLWKVPDEPTASLMTEFYRRWRRNPDKAAALRQAMLTTMKKHPQPRNWAAFTLIGEAR